MSFYRALAADPDLLGIGWDLPDTLKFIKLALYLKPYIASTLRVADLDTPPLHLPVNIHDFFKLAIGLADEEVKIAWDGFRNAIWESVLGGDGDDDPVTAFSKVSEYTEDFVDFGLARFIGTSPCILHLNREIETEIDGVLQAPSTFSRRPASVRMKAVLAVTRQVDTSGLRG